MVGAARQHFTFAEYVRLESESRAKHEYLQGQVWAMAGGTVEVLRPSTEAYDRGEKLAHYKRIATLSEIVLVSHDEHRLEVWRRDGDRWDLEVAHGHEVVRLRSIECDLPLDEVYRNPLGDGG